LQAHAIAGIGHGGVNTAESRTGPHRHDHAGPLRQFPSHIHSRPALVTVVQARASWRGDDAALHAKDIQGLHTTDDTLEHGVMLARGCMGKRWMPEQFDAVRGKELLEAGRIGAEDGLRVTAASAGL
jgi:hypothetical protein